MMLAVADDGFVGFIVGKRPRRYDDVARDWWGNTRGVFQAVFQAQALKHEGGVCYLPYLHLYDNSDRFQMIERVMLKDSVGVTGFRKDTTVLAMYWFTACREDETSINKPPRAECRQIWIKRNPRVEKMKFQDS
jgi:hypothetical protein